MQELELRDRWSLALNPSLQEVAVAFLVDVE
jgi:hypothetical protein